MYRGKIDSWIIWNEPDITPEAPNAAYFLWAGTPADYYQLLKVAYAQRPGGRPRGADRAAPVTYWTDIHLGREQWFGRFLDAVAADPTARQHGQYFDVCALNLYTSPQSLYTVPNLYHQLMRERGFDKPIWVTETNVVPHDDPVNAGSPLATRAQRRASLAEQADFVVQALAMGLAAGVQRVAVYRMKDGDGDVVDGQALLREDLSPRPAYGAFQVAAQYFSRFEAARLFAPGDLRQVVFDSRARRVSVLWAAGPQPLTRAGARRGRRAGPARRPRPGRGVLPRCGPRASAFEVELAPGDGEHRPGRPRRLPHRGAPGGAGGGGAPAPGAGGPEPDPGGAAPLPPRRRARRRPAGVGEPPRLTRAQRTRAPLRGADTASRRPTGSWSARSGRGRPGAGAFANPPNRKRSRLRLTGRRR